MDDGQVPYMRSATKTTSVIPAVALQHAGECAALGRVRSTLLRAPHVRLVQLDRLDERLAAHFDGVRLADSFGVQICEQALETPDEGSVFTFAVRAIEDRSARRLEKLAALVGAVPDALPAVMGGFGWVSTEALRGITVPLLSSEDPRRRSIGLAACAMHGVDPGRVLDDSLQHSDSFLRARALRVAAEVGRADLLPEARRALQDEVPAVRYRAAWSACLLGDRQNSIQVLAELAQSGERFSHGALHLVSLAASFEWTHEFLRGLPTPEGRDLPMTRRLIRASGLTGNIAYVPWLIRQMDDEKLARIAGEAFSFISGADLAWLDLERRPPEHFESGPNDDPDDDDVAMDEDEGLPWPDKAKVEAWWNANADRFRPGIRYFVGAPPTWEHCLHILKTGYQRQRVAAAQFRCLLRPGTPLFNTSAPAWRQKRLLDAMT